MLEKVFQQKKECIGKETGASANVFKSGASFFLCPFV